MKMRSLSLWSFALLVSLAACNGSSEDHSGSHAKVDLEEVKEIIQNKENWLAESENTKNLKEALLFYRDDIITYAPGKAPRVGLDAKRKHLAETIMVDTNYTTVRFETLEVDAEGDLVVETGQWFAFDEAGWEKDKGIYMAIFRKVDGEYVCTREIWNSTMPKKEEETPES